MAEKFEQITHTIIKTWGDQATDAELDELRKWANDSPDNLALLHQFEDDEWLGSEIGFFNNNKREENRQKLWQQIDEQELEKKPPRRIFWKLVAAAAVLVLIGTGWWLLKTPRRQSVPGALVSKTDSAQIVLKDTSVIVFESPDGVRYDMQKGPDMLLTEQGDLAMYRKDHKLVVSLLPQIKRKHTKGYAKLIIPGGGRYQVVLSDGTKVWLNAASSLSIPAVDTGRFRRVSVSGEAYFEVTHKTRPFMVQLPDGSSVEVTGTVFNVTAYPDEAVIKTTLMEGSVNIRKGKQTKTIQSGQQAVISGNMITVKSDIDTEQVTAWKDGMFYFENDSITMVVRELARAYNLEPDIKDTPVVFVSYADSSHYPVERTLQGIRRGNPRVNLKREGNRLVLRR